MYSSLPRVLSILHHSKHHNHRSCKPALLCPMSNECRDVLMPVERPINDQIVHVKTTMEKWHSYTIHCIHIYVYLLRLKTQKLPNSLEKR